MSTPPPPDGRYSALQTLQDLTQAARGGDHEAFSILHRRLNGGLKAFFHRKTGGGTDLIDELAQQTWTSAWSALSSGRYDPKKASFSTFLYAIGYKTWLRHMRDDRGTPRPIDDLDRYVSSATDESADPAAFLRTVELLDAVRDCLHTGGRAYSLTDEERRIVIGMTQGRTDRGMAAELGLAASTVNARRQSAYAKLKTCLSRKGFGEGP